ncbi:MAG: hypothetical protein M1114_02495 [Candidatus Dependentiae bacterium]|nr:hypothetical protein [Candidatus Dependentiae bacterium]
MNASYKIFIMTSFFFFMGSIYTQTLKSTLADFVIGATSGAAGMVVYTPFHYLQNRKIQKLPIHTNPLCWFRGMPSLALGKAPSIAIQMSTYGLITKIISQKKEYLSHQQKTFASLISGAAAGIINNFTHLVTLHQENHGTPFVTTIKNLPSPQITLTRGLGTTISREILFAHVFLVLLQDMKKVVNSKINNHHIAEISCGLLSGGIIAATTQPFMVITGKLYADLSKKRYKN